MSEYFQTTNLNMNNEQLRDMLTNLDFGAATHLLASITYGPLFIFSIAIPSASPAIRLVTPEVSTLDIISAFTNKF
jgi:hypothetical protein